MQQTVIQTIQRDSVISFPMLGDLHLNPPSFITLFGRDIYFYGIIIALGFLLAMFYCTRNARRFGIKEDDLYDAFLWLIPFSILGARLYYVAFKLDFYLANPGEIFALREGGLAIYGGVIAGIIVIALVCRKKKIPLGAMLDLLVFGLLIGQILGRWGNFMNAEVYGNETTLPWRMRITDWHGTFEVHPLFLYESLWNLLGFVIIQFIYKNKKYDGQIFLFYLFWYGLIRSILEPMRSDTFILKTFGGLPISFMISAAACAAALIIMIVKSVKTRKKEETI